MGGQGRKILLIASGFMYAARQSRNLGDVAQQANTINRLQRRIKGAKILAVANSLNDRPALEGLNLSHLLVAYLSKRDDSSLRNRLLPRKVLAAFRAVLFVWNANRLARGQRTLWLSQDGTEAMRELQDADGLVVSGAGAFNDRFANHVGLVWGIIMRSVAAFGKPVVVSGQQIGPLNRFVCRRVTRWALQVARVVGVRDPISIDVATALGIPTDRIVLTGDDAWGLEPSGEDEAARVLSRYEISGRFIVAQIRLDPATDLKPQDAPKLASMLDKLAEMLELPIVFVRMYYAAHNDDAVSAKQVQSFMARQSVIIDEELSPALTKAVLKSATLAVGISYHFCIFAVSAGTPTLGLHRSEYMNHKLDGISQMWGSRMTSLSLDDGNVMDEVRAYIERTKQEILSDTSRQSLRTEYHVQEEAAISALIDALDIQKDAVSRRY